MSTKTRLKLTYRRPSFVEGISRVFDVLGVLKDDFRVYRVHHAHHHHGEGGSDDQSGGMTVSPENIGTKAINLAFHKVHKNMGAVADTMRPSVPTRHRRSTSR
jgi:hypothetical protein